MHLISLGNIRGWEFGEGRTIACANVNGKYLAVDGRCPRCAFDLYRGKLLVDAEVWGPEPRVACPTCSVTYSLKTGKFGPEYKASGLAGFVSTWAKTATVSIGNTLLDGSKTVSAVSNTTFSYTAQPNVTTTASVGSIVFSNSSATVTNKRLLNNEAILTVNAGHNLQVGNIVTVDVDDPVLDGTRTISSVTSTTVKYVMQANVSSTAISPAGSVTAVSPSTNAPTTVSNKVLSNNLATITVPTGHGYSNGNVIAISGVGSGFDGEQTITSTTATTITFKSQDDIASAAVTGTIDIRGVVGPIGGINEKILSAKKAGATIFFAPVGNAEEIANVPEGIKVITVATLAQAVSYLERTRA